MLIFLRSKIILNHIQTQFQQTHLDTCKLTQNCGQNQILLVYETYKLGPKTCKTMVFNHNFRRLCIFAHSQSNQAVLSQPPILSTKTLIPFWESPCSAQFKEYPRSGEHPILQTHPYVVSLDGLPSPTFFRVPQHECAHALCSLIETSQSQLYYWTNFIVYVTVLTVLFCYCCA